MNLFDVMENVIVIWNRDKTDCKLVYISDVESEALKTVLN